MDISSIRDTSIFVVIAGLVYEYPATGDEKPADTHARVRAFIAQLLSRPPGERLFMHEKPSAPEASQSRASGVPLIEMLSLALPIVSFLHVAEGVQVQVLPGTFFKAFMREQQALAARAGGIGGNPAILRG